MSYSDQTLTSHLKKNYLLRIISKNHSNINTTPLNTDLWDEHRVFALLKNERDISQKLMKSGRKKYPKHRPKQGHKSFFFSFIFINPRVVPCCQVVRVTSFFRRNLFYLKSSAFFLHYFMKTIVIIIKGTKTIKELLKFDAWRLNLMPGGVYITRKTYCLVTIHSHL